MLKPSKFLKFYLQVKDYPWPSEDDDECCVVDCSEQPYIHFDGTLFCWDHGIEALALYAEAGCY